MKVLNYIYKKDVFFIDVTGVGEAIHKKILN